MFVFAFKFFESSTEAIIGTVNLLLKVSCKISAEEMKLLSSVVVTVIFYLSTGRC